MADIYTFRSGLYYRARRRFDDALRPITSGGGVVSYPDAFYWITQADLDRAKEAVSGN
jgi:hypothetical protein